MADFNDIVDIVYPLLDSYTWDESDLVMFGSEQDTTPPVVTLISPSAGSHIGRADPITVEVTDETGLRDTWLYVSMASDREVIWGGGLEGFSPRYSTSTRSAIAGGYRYVLRRDGGWFSSPTVHVLAIDTGGNQA